MELLHESRLDIIKVEGKAYFFQTEPKLNDKPVVVPDTTVDGAGTSIYGSVIHDSGRYRMWYQAWPADWDGGDVSLVGYAESDDGVVWEKPPLGLVDYNGKKNNLCNLGFHSPSVFTDPKAPSESRYRATGYARPKRTGSSGVSRAGYFTAHSDDGLNWSLETTEPAWEGADVITSVYHPGRQTALVALKRYYHLAGIPRRSILHAVWDGSKKSNPLSALVPDEFDDVGAISRGFVSGDYYGMGLMPAGQGTVGFLWQFRHKLPRTAERETGVFGATDLSLVFQQREGDRWSHSPGRPDFLSHRQVPWGMGGIYTANSPVDVGDEQRLYFSAARHSHAWYLDHTWKLQEDLRDRLVKEGLARIGFISWKKDRLFGYRADPDGVIELHLENIAFPAELYLNYRCETGGFIRVETSTVSDILKGDELDAVVRWNGASQCPLDGSGPAVFRIHLHSAEVFSYDIRPI